MVHNKKRIYLDYNSTSPYAERILKFLRVGDFSFANPSSTHSAGKVGRKIINDTSHFILKTFSVEKSHKIFYHSGATEGVNTLFNQNQLTKDDSFICFVSDHPAVINTAKFLQANNYTVEILGIDSNGNVNQDDLISKINELNNKCNGKVWLNATYINNETGVIWPLDELRKIKELTGCFVHVDAVQSIGKVENWHILESNLDAYSFSAHKFGAFKGIGFTLLANDLKIIPLIHGGGQQGNLRSGTENVLGIQSIKFALQDILEDFNYSKALGLRAKIEKLFTEKCSSKGSIAAGNATYGRCSNTICIVFNDIRGDLAQVQFDFAGVDVSFGSACSSGSALESPVLLAMGYGNKSSNSIRISFGPKDYLNENKILTILDTIFSKL